MSNDQTPSKDQILKAIEKLEQDPYNKIGILADIGIGVVGAAGTGAAIAAFGGTSILFGLITLAPPVGIVIGGAALGAAALVGVKKILFDGTYSEGQRDELLNQLKEQMQEVEAKERASQLGENDKTKFILLLKEPVKFNLITPEDAQNLISAVEAGQLPIKEAIKMVQDIVKAARL